MANAQGVSTSAYIKPEYSYYSFSQLLPFARQYMNIALVAQVKPLPKNASTVAHFTRVERLETDPIELTEGITPNATKVVVNTIEATIKQYGRFIEYTDKVEDTSFLSVIKAFAPILGENMGAVLESINATELCSGTSVVFTNGVARSSVNTVLSANAIKKAIRILEGNFAKKVTKQNNPANLFDTSAIRASYVAFAHSDMRADIEAISGFVPVEKYASGKPLCEEEIGSINGVRFIMNNFVTKIADGGATGGTNVISTTGTNADVYCIPVVAEDAFGVINLTGYGAGKMMYVPVGEATKSDPLAQRGSIGYKVWHTAKILNENFVVRIEAACSGL